MSYKCNWAVDSRKGWRQIKTILFLAALSMTGLFSCSQKFVRNVEAWEDEEEYKRAITGQQKITQKIKVNTETDPVVVTNVTDDSADDPAIWYNEQDPSKSVVYGSNKLRGIHSYNLKGKQIQYVPCGKINNIDVRKGISLGGKLVDILAGSNRTDNSIVFFIIGIDGSIAAEPNFSVALRDFSPYGFCLYKARDNQLYAFVNSKIGLVKQFHIDLEKDGNLTVSIARKLQLPTQIEGMVVDDLKHTLYVGEEQTGIHIFSALADGSTEGVLLEGSTDKNPNIRYDVEGLALLAPHYLVASSQGNFSFAIFDLELQKYIGSFVLEEGAVDGVEETDGIEILSMDLGDGFSEGIMIAQDGFNLDDEKKVAQNFKFVNLEQILTLIRG